MARDTDSLRMNTPRLENLVADVSKSSYLEKMLERTTSSYKFFWVKGILDIVCGGQLEMAFDSIIARMVASAWYPVLYFHLSLGATDQLGKIVNYVHDAYGIARTASESEVAKAVGEQLAKDGKLAKMAKNMANYVPYRTIRPFYEYEVVSIQDELKSQGVKRVDTKTDAIIIEQNRLNPDKAIYAISQDQYSLRVSREWAQFIRDNQAIIYGWFDAKLTAYLQLRNPSIPAISMKLRPPKKRDLASAIRYWKFAIDSTQLHDIYLDAPFGDASFSKNGPLSIDHFVPWSFVLNDENWNLSPTFRNVNSAKSDRLPDLELYFKPFCEVQFKALMAVKESGAQRRFESQLDSYRMIDAEVDRYVDNDNCRDLFTQSLTKAIMPLYQIALNQGYVAWRG